ncbi:ABC transporter permease [Parasediminibacterium sp. JCM 36343]|uniref:ABC transporter permease n=1 Tax=Parasediminibacterium sp. JCM 36343 TaxID=3374279 RepID=UPI00397A7EA4
MTEFTIHHKTALVDEEWSEVISPKTALFDLRLGEVWRYRDLLVMFVKRDFVAAYKQTILGPIWHFVQPILTTIMFIVVFSRIANISTDGIKPMLFYMSGLAIWNYFSACLTGTSNTFVGNAAIFGKVYFPRLILPLSVVISNIIKFGIQFLLFFVVMTLFWIGRGDTFYFGWTWLLIPVLLVLMAGLGLGLGIIISSVTTKYRDFTVLIGFGIQLLMYATPVIYPLSFLLKKGTHLWVINLNPLSPVLEGFRYAVFNTHSFNFASLWYAFACMLVSLFIGLLMFNRIERTFMDTV